LQEERNAAKGSLTKWLVRSGEVTLGGGNGVVKEEKYGLIVGCAENFTTSEKRS